MADIVDVAAGVTAIAGKKAVDGMGRGTGERRVVRSALRPAKIIGLTVLAVGDQHDGAVAGGERACDVAIIRYRDRGENAADR